MKNSEQDMPKIERNMIFALLVTLLVCGLVYSIKNFNVPNKQQHKQTILKQGYSSDIVKSGQSWTILSKDKTKLLTFDVIAVDGNDLVYLERQTDSNKMTMKIKASDLLLIADLNE